MAKGLPRSLARGDKQRQELIKETVVIDGLTVSVADGSPGFGTAVIRDLPEGNLCLLGALAYLQFETSDADITATFEGDYSIGTAPTADGSLAGGEVDIIPSTALAAATAKVSPRTRGVQSDGAFAGKVFDNTDGSLEINLNLLIDDLDISGAADFTATGVLHLAYTVLGDD